MLSRGARKFGGPSVGARPASAYAVPLEADALHLPLKSASLDLIVTAFGFRNLANYEAGLREFHRVLKPGGQLGILEFSEPGGLIGKAYAVYFRRVLPAIGRLICGKDGPYNYLPTSVGNFPPPRADAGAHAVHRLRAIARGSPTPSASPGCTRPRARLYSRACNDSRRAQSARSQSSPAMTMAESSAEKRRSRATPCWLRRS